MATWKSDEGAVSKREDEEKTQLPGATSKSSGSSNSLDQGNSVIKWTGPEDQDNPRNWSMKYRLWLASIIWINVFTLEWASGADSQVSSKAASVFHVSDTVESLCSALYVIGIAIGALPAGPITETVGRRPVFVYTRITHMSFLLGASFAKQAWTQLVCRFLAGLSASFILAIHAASIADLFNQHERSLVWPVVAFASFSGSEMSPVVGGWIQQSSRISWRWTERISLLQSAVAFILTVIFLPETFSPIILRRRARELRKQNRDQEYIADIEDSETLKQRLQEKIQRAFIMSTREYIVMLLGLWLVVLYVSIFGFLQGFKYIFERIFHFSAGLTGTSFLSIIVGLVIYTLLSPYYYMDMKRRQRNWLRQHGPDGPIFPPESRLIPSIIPAITFPISMFLLGWTNYASLTPWPNLIACALFGFSWAGIYVAVYNYILDVYGIFAGTALSTITFFRYIVAGGMVVASGPLYRAIGVHWTTTILAIIATILAIAPFFFLARGEKVRERSRYANIELRQSSTDSALYKQ